MLSNRHRLISIPAAVAVISIAGYFAWHPDSSPARTAGAATESAASLATARSAAPEAGSNSALRETTELRLAVNGIVIAPASKGAVISIGDQPARLFAEGEKIADGVVLRAVSTDRVVVERGGELLRFRVRGAASGSAPVVLPDAETVPDERPVPVPPLGTEERRAYQSQNRD